MNNSFISPSCTGDTSGLEAHILPVTHHIYSEYELTLQSKPARSTVGLSDLTSQCFTDIVTINPIIGNYIFL
jgi:hypothetical protein